MKWPWAKPEPEPERYEYKDEVINAGDPDCDHVWKSLDLYRYDWMNTSGRRCVRCSNFVVMSSRPESWGKLR